MLEEEEKHAVDQTEQKETDAKQASGEKPKKKKKGKTLLETMREIDEQEAQREEERRAKQREILAQKEKEEKEEYAKQIQRERIELIRQKQGITTENDTIHEEAEEKLKLSLGKKIANFFYHSKWWLWISVFIVGVFVFLLVDYLTQEKPDMIVMVLTDDSYFQNYTKNLEEYFEQFTDDENGDGKVHVDIYPIPVTDDIGDMDYYTGNATKLSAEFHMADSVLILTDAKANEYISAEETLADLETLYPGHDNIRGNGYYLRHTDFATKVGYTGKVDRDLALSLRTPIKTYDSKEEMQENYDIAEKVLLRIMDDLDNTTEPEDVVLETETETEAES